MKNSHNYSYFYFHVPHIPCYNEIVKYRSTQTIVGQDNPNNSHPLLPSVPVRIPSQQYIISPSPFIHLLSLLDSSLNPLKTHLPHTHTRQTSYTYIRRVHKRYSVYVRARCRMKAGYNIIGLIARFLARHIYIL